MGDKKKKDEEASRASSSSLPAPHNESTQKPPIQTGGDSSVTPPTSAPPAAYPVKVCEQSRKRKRPQTEQGEDVLCPVCFISFKSMQSMRGHMHMHKKSDRDRFFGLPKSKLLKREELMAAMNLALMKSADNFWPVNNQTGISGADAMEDALLGTPLRTTNRLLDIDCNKTPPGGALSSSPPPPSPPREHPRFLFNLNRSPPTSPGAAGQAQAAPVV